VYSNTELLQYLMRCLSASSLKSYVNVYCSVSYVCVVKSYLSCISSLYDGLPRNIKPRTVVPCPENEMILVQLGQ
jgi:hypothetical protein